MSFLSSPTPKESTIYKMSPTAPVTWLHNDILNNHMLTLMGLHFGRKCQNNHTHTLTSNTPSNTSELQNNLWRRSRCSRSVRHTWRRVGNSSGEDSQRLRKNGFVHGGIQQREGFSKGVFRQMAKGILALCHLYSLCLFAKNYQCTYFMS